MTCAEEVSVGDEYLNSEGLLCHLLKKKIKTHKPAVKKDLISPVIINISRFLLLGKMY